MKNSIVAIFFLVLLIGNIVNSKEKMSLFPIEQYFNQLQKVGVPPEDCITKAQINERMILLRSNVSKINCEKPFNANLFCQRIIEKNSCPTTETCSYLGRPERLRPEEKKKIFKTTKELFDRMITNPNIHSMCCGPSNMSCIKRLKSTRLAVVKRGEKGHYEWYSHRILLSEMRILISYHVESIEELLLHELGHACQHSRSGGLAGFLKYQICHISSSSSHDFDMTVGIQTRKCIIKRLEDHASITKEKTCLSAWASEAFADTIFSAWWNRTGHWFTQCYSGENETHSDPKIYMPCIFERGAPRRQICIP